MDFNIKKYDRMTFHKDELVNKRVKALFLWFDYEVYKKKLSHKQQIILIDYWVGELTRMEYYEIIPFFKKRRLSISHKIKMAKKLQEKKEKSQAFFNKIIDFFKNIFK
jgi:hypothetical protein